MHVNNGVHLRCLHASHFGRAIDGTLGQLEHSLDLNRQNIMRLVLFNRLGQRRGAEHTSTPLYEHTALIEAEEEVEEECPNAGVYCLTGFFLVRPQTSTFSQNVYTHTDEVSVSLIDILPRMSRHLAMLDTAREHGFVLMSGVCPPSCCTLLDFDCLRLSEDFFVKLPTGHLATLTGDKRCGFA